MHPERVFSLPGGPTARTPGAGNPVSTARTIGVFGQGGLVSGTSGDVVGVFGTAATGAGEGFGVVGEGERAAVFSNGDNGASGTKNFVIDHPADPANKLLKHFSIESDEALLMYRGRAELDADGEAVVTLPDYVELINRKFTYDLTPIGAPMPNLYIATEVADGKFRIAGGAPGKVVSWKLTGERNDPYMQQHPEKREVVITKKPIDQDRYFHPELYGQPEDKAFFKHVTYEVSQTSEKAELQPMKKVQRPAFERPETSKTEMNMLDADLRTAKESVEAR